MTRFLIEGAPALAPGTFPYAQIRFVSPDYFRTMGIGLLKGRTFTRSDIDSTTGFFIVNEAFARHYLSARDPIGANILIGVMSPTPTKSPSSASSPTPAISASTPTPNRKSISPDSAFTPSCSSAPHSAPTRPQHWFGTQSSPPTPPSPSITSNTSTRSF